MTGKQRNPRQPSDALERFDSKILGEPNSGCWLWMGGTNQFGYGRFAVDATRANMKRVCAHRFSYERYIGPIPDGLDVLHKCDTPGCPNPDHLFVGTQAENMRDMVSKGRGGSQRHPGLVIGERNPQAKLMDDDIRAIRGANGTMVEIGRRFGVSAANVCNIKKRKTWHHVQDEFVAA